MTLLSPLWLALLVPWAAACVWAGRGGGRAAGVPALFLWPTPPATRGPKRRPPPAWAVLLLLASSAAILAAAGPAWTTDVVRVTVVVDRTPSMTPKRLRAAFDAMQLPTNAHVRVVPVPGEAFETTAGAFDATRVSPTAAGAPLAEPGRPSAIDDRDAVRRRAEREAAGVVIGDRAVDVPAGVLRATPQTPLMNAGIDRFVVVAADGGQARAMVRVFNGSERQRGRLALENLRAADGLWLPLPIRPGEGWREGFDKTRSNVGRFSNQERLSSEALTLTLSRPYRESGPEAVLVGIEMPATGTTRDYFFDLPPVGEAVAATLLAEDGTAFADDVPGDDAAFVARTASPARVVPRGPVSDPLGRMLAVYANRRPAAADAAEATVGHGDAGDGPAVVLTTATRPPPAIGGAAGDIAETVTVDASHPVGRSLVPALFDGVGRAAGPPAGAGWRVLVRAGDTPLLAVRETPARQAWVGFDADALAASPAYVVFWADVLDWVGGGAAAWDAVACREGIRPVRTADAALVASPGVYRDAAGRLVAMAMDAVRPETVAGPPATAVGPAGVGGPLPDRIAPAVVPLSPVLWLAAVLLCAVGVAWRNLTES